MIWGDPIEVNGVRPAWLADDIVVQRKDRAATGPHPWGFPQPFQIHAGDPEWSTNWIQAIRLPADHFAYLAIAKGFEPWAGGDSAPEDWDGGDVLLLDGFVVNLPFTWSASHLNKVIGYKRKQATDDGHYVRVKRMTEAEARLSWSSDTSTDAMKNGDWHIELLRRMGLIREPTQAETIATKTGLTVDQVQSVLNEVNNGTR